MRDDVLRAIWAAAPDGYTFTRADGSPAGDEPDPLGAGGSGVVVRALQRDRLPRALKFIVPRDDLNSDDSGARLFAEAFYNELELLSGINHQNIARITDFGEVSLGGQAVPFFAMDLIQGEPITEFAARADASGKQILTALRQLLNAIEFLHERDVMHCDVKPDNFLVSLSADGRARGFLIDLGVAHLLKASERGDRDLTYFFTTRAYSIPDLELAVANQSHNRIAKRDLSKFFPAQDLYSVGVIFRNLLESVDTRHKLREVVGSKGLDALAFIAGGLAARKDQQRYQTIAQVQEAMTRIAPSALSPLGENLLQSTSSRGIVLPDIVGRVSTPGQIDAIISHPLFQRLHHLPQLDLMQYLLPGATHTRYTHALREMNLARRAINIQLHNWQFRIAVDRSDIQRTLLSAVLNSVGRYQLLHMFEDFFPIKSKLASAGLVTSDEFLSSIMHGDDSGPLGELAVSMDSGGRTLADIAGSDWEPMQALKKSPQTAVQGFLAGLLESPLDVNRLAYSRADSVATGMPFGHGINHDALLQQFRVVEEAEWATFHRKAVVGLREDGISYAEAAILVRYWSIQSGYWNRTNRSLQSMVKFVIAELLRSESLDFPAFLSDNLHGSTNQSMTWLSARFERARSLGKIDRSAVNPLADLLLSRRTAYKRLLTISPRSIVHGREADQRVYRSVERKSPLDDIEICELVAEELAKLVPGISIRPGEILLDVPRARRDESSGRVLVYSDPPEPAYIDELHKASPVLRNLGESFEQYVKRLRIFIHPRISDAIHGQDVAVHTTLLDRLRNDAEENLL